MSSRKLKVLLVDSDEIIRIYFHDIFWINGFEHRCELSVAADFETAERVIADPATRPDVMFLDLTLPKKVGDRTLVDPKYSFDLLQRVKGDPATKDIKVIIFSSHTEREFRDEAMAKGADQYLLKEQSLPKDLVAAVNRALGAAAA